MRFAPGVQHGSVEREQPEEAGEDAVIFESVVEGFEGWRACCCSDARGCSQEAAAAACEGGELGVEEERGVAGCGEEGVEAGGGGEGAG